MSGLWIVTIALIATTLVLCGGGAYLIFRHDKLSGLFALGVLSVILGICAGIFAVIVPAATLGGRAYGRVECRNYGERTGRPVRFVVYTSLDSGDCLTRTAEGKWISTSQLRGVAGAP